MWQGTEKMPKFSNRDQECLSDRLSKLNQLVAIDWEFQEDSLVVTGLSLAGEVVTGGVEFSHPRSALAFIDGFLAGYDEGFGAARQAEED